jgi:alkanesulfonate monooxygenase
VDYGYHRQLAQGYDHLGYTGALFATGAHDMWVLAGGLLPYTERMRFLVAVHPGLIAPTLLAKMAATFQDFLKGPLLISIVSGDAKMLGAYGMKLPNDERYDMADEYLTLWHMLFAGETVSHQGRCFLLEGARLALPVGKGISRPPPWFGGSSEKALDVAAKQVDAYLYQGETPQQIAVKIADAKERAARLGRTLEYGLRLSVIMRDTDALAWEAAEALYREMDDEAIAANRHFVSNTDSVGQQRMSVLHGGVKPANLRDLEIAPDLWAGIGLVRPGPGTAIVGSPDTVIRTREAYRAAGIETFILSGIPLLEEAYRFGEKVPPRLDLARDAPTAKHFTWSTLFDRYLGGTGSEPAP